MMGSTHKMPDALDLVVFDVNETLSDMTTCNNCGRKQGPTGEGYPS